MYFYLYSLWIFTYSALAIGVEIDAFEVGTQQNLVGFLINYKKTNIFSPLNPSNLLYFYLYRPWILRYSALAIGVEIDAFEDFFPTTFFIFTKNHWAGTQTSPRTHWHVGTRKFTWCQLLTTCDCIPTSDTDINCLFKFTLVKYVIITNTQF